MAAGLGFKDFVTGEVLTAADVDGYLMQGVWVFASAAARDAAVTSPQEGNFAYLKDTNVTTYYTGSAWANLDTTGMTNPMTTTGDTIYSSSGSTPARLGIGSTGNVLTVSGGVPTWAAPAGGGGMTLLSTTTLSGSTTSITGISSSYTNLLITVSEAVSQYDYEEIYLTLNSDSGNNYNNGYFRVFDTTNAGFNFAAASKIVLGRSTSDTTLIRKTNLFANVFNYTSTATKFTNYFSTTGMVSTSNVTFSGGGAYSGSSAISSIQLTLGAGTWSSGTVLVYGVK